LLGLQKLRAIGVQRCIVHTDSKVVAGQIEKSVLLGSPPSRGRWALSEEWRITLKDSH
jgi:ribonuclease HI